VAALAEAVRARGAQEVFVDAALTGLQQRTLRAALGVPVLLDRVGLILAIFGQKARTREAKLAVELAALDYRATQLVRERGGGPKGKRAGFGEGGATQVRGVDAFTPRGGGGLGLL